MNNRQIVNKQIADAVLVQGDQEATKTSPGSRVLNLPVVDVERIMSELNIEADAELITVLVRGLVAARRRLE